VAFGKYVFTKSRTLGEDFTFAFVDYDEDGQADFITSENCIADKVVVSLDENSFKNYKNSVNYNFCYTKTSPWRVVASKALIIGTWTLEVAVSISTAPAAAVTIPLLQAGMAYASSKLDVPTHWPEH